MNGTLSVVGLGPGAADLCAPRAAAALRVATDLVGYSTYLGRVTPHSGQTLHASDNREELERACLALTLAAEGRRVAVVSSGDPGVFAMASAVFEAIDDGPSEWRALPVEVVPGISALLAAAARLGAPLGHDFCALSLSDNLKPWTVVLHRLRAAAAAGFVVALYNPASRARPWQLGAAFDLLRTVLAPQTPVAFATAVSRADERLIVQRLDEADPSLADMRTLIVVGSEATRTVRRQCGRPWLYAPRRVARQ